MCETGEHVANDIDRYGLLAVRPVLGGRVNAGLKVDKTCCHGDSVAEKNAKTRDLCHCRADGGGVGEALSLHRMLSDGDGVAKYSARASHEFYSAYTSERDTHCERHSLFATMHRRSPDNRDIATALRSRATTKLGTLCTPKKNRLRSCSLSSSSPHVHFQSYRKTRPVLEPRRFGVITHAKSRRLHLNGR